MNNQIFQSPQTQAIIQYTREEYGHDPEFLWKTKSDGAILRNPQTRKWYALFMIVSKDKLGFDSTEKVEILDLRFDRHQAPDFVASNPDILPGYHMNKQNWITIILDNTSSLDQIRALLDHSYQLTQKH